jgi:DNA-binding PadR family transcriptional regulator
MGATGATAGSWGRGHGRSGSWSGPWPGPWAEHWAGQWMPWMAMAAARAHRGGRFGGPRGGFPFGGPPFRGGPRAKRGDVRAAALALLAEQPMNGYQIIEEIARRSGGVWRPSSGSVYPALQQLEDEGLIRADQSEGRRLFHLTEDGRTYVEEHRDELSAPWDAVADGMPDGLFELRDLIGQVAMAFTQVAHVGTEAQVAEAKQVLAETRRALYRILAEGDTGEAGATGDTGDAGDT